MKKRGIKSPDLAESLILTFALPVKALIPEVDKSSPILKALASDFNSKRTAIQKSYR